MAGAEPAWGPGNGIRAGSRLNYTQHAGHSSISPSSLVIFTADFTPQKCILSPPGQDQTRTSAREFLLPRPAAGQRNSGGHPQTTPARNTHPPPKLFRASPPGPPSRQDGTPRFSPLPLPHPPGAAGTSRSPGTKSRAEDALPRGQPSIVGKTPESIQNAEPRGKHSTGGVGAMPAACVCVCPGLTWLPPPPPPGARRRAPPAPRPHGRSGGAAHRRAVSGAGPLRPIAGPRGASVLPRHPRPRLLPLQRELGASEPSAPAANSSSVPDPRSCRSSLAGSWENEAYGTLSSFPSIRDSPPVFSAAEVTFP